MGEESWSHIRSFAVFSLGFVFLQFYVCVFELDCCSRYDLLMRR